MSFENFELKLCREILLIATLFAIIGKEIIPNVEKDLIEMYNYKHYEEEARVTKARLMREKKINEANNITIPVTVLPDQLSFVMEKDLEDDTVILRYMDYDKFQYLVQKAVLYMPAPICFLQDTSEGYLIPEVGKYYDSICEHIYEVYIPRLKGSGGFIEGFPLSWKKSIDLPKMKARWRQIYKHNIKRFFISCWTERNVDQDNMWRAYIPDSKKRERSVAIKTTIGKLKIALKYCTGMFSIRRIKYVDLDTVKLNSVAEVAQGLWATGRYMLGLKDLCYEDDHEIRVMTDNMMSNTTQWYRGGVMTLLGIKDFDYDAVPDKQAFEAPLDLREFFEEIIVSPTSREGFIQEIQTLLSANDVQNVKIIKSRVNKRRSLL